MIMMDRDVVEGLKTGEPTLVLENLHADTEYHYSDQGLLELCESNEYEFHENGEVVRLGL
jgi:hypothetical protein